MNLKKSFENCYIVEKNGYNYFVHPLTDGIPSVTPGMLDDVCDFILENVIGYYDDKLSKIDKIVTVEAMGISIATSLSMITGIPFTIIRKRSYKLPDEIVIPHHTGYSKGELYLNGISKGDRVLVVDDVISTGGTMKAVICALELAGAEIVDIVVVVDKNNGSKRIRRYDIKTLISIDVTEDGVMIKE